MNGQTRRAERMQPGNGAVASIRARDRVDDREHCGGYLSRDDRANLLRFMAMMRAAEERAITLYRQGKVPGSFYDGSGQEAISVGAAYAHGPRDRTFNQQRDYSRPRACADPHTEDEK